MPGSPALTRKLTTTDAVVVGLGSMVGAGVFATFGPAAAPQGRACSSPDVDRRYPQWLQALGLVGCLALMAALPWMSVGAGLAVVAIGLAGRAALRRNG